MVELNIRDIDCNLSLNTNELMLINVVSELDPTRTNTKVGTVLEILLSYDLRDWLIVLSESRPCMFDTLTYTYEDHLLSLIECVWIPLECDITIHRSRKVIDLSIFTWLG